MKKRFNQVKRNKTGFIVLLLLLVWGTAGAQIRFSVSDNQPRYIELIPFYENSYSKEQIINFSQWINYTTLVEYQKPSFRVTVQLVSKKLPQGLKLNATVGPYVGYSKDGTGTEAGKITLSRATRTLVDNITTCYSGSGRGEGFKVDLHFMIPDRIQEDKSAYTINLVYTITQ